MSGTAFVMDWFTDRGFKLGVAHATARKDWVCGNCGVSEYEAETRAVFNDIAPCLPPDADGTTYAHTFIPQDQVE